MRWSDLVYRERRLKWVGVGAVNGCVLGIDVKHNRLGRGVRVGS